MFWTNEVMPMLKEHIDSCIRIIRKYEPYYVSPWDDEATRKQLAEKEIEFKQEKYWEEHPEDKKKANELKAEYVVRVKLAHAAKIDKENAESLVKKLEDTINDMNCKISAGNDLIAKQQKKIFGKAKAKEVIVQTQKELAEYQKTIVESNQSLCVARENRDSTTKVFDEENAALASAKSVYESFMKKCGL